MRFDELGDLVRKKPDKVSIHAALW